MRDGNQAIVQFSHPDYYASNTMLEKVDELCARPDENFGVTEFVGKLLRYGRTGSSYRANESRAALHVCLRDLPSLDTWPLLDRFIAYNVEETLGKRIRQQIKARAKTRPWADHASVSQLRKPEWWTSEFGRPFSA